MSLWLAHLNCVEANWNRFSGGDNTNLLFNYFEVFNERILGKETGMRDSVVKRVEKPL